MVTNFQPSRIFNHRILFGWIFRGRKRIFKFFLNELLKKKMMVMNFQPSRIFNHRIFFGWIFRGNKFSNSKFFLNEFLKKMVTNFQPSNSLSMNFRRRKWWSRIFNHRILFEWTFEEENDSHEFSIIESFLKKKMMIESLLWTLEKN